MKRSANREWFDDLYRQNYLLLLKIANGLLRNRSTAEELVEEAFLILWSKRKRLREHPAPVNWLVKTLRYLIRNESRLAKYRMEVLLDTVPEPWELPAEPDSLADYLPKELSQKERRILILYFEQELEYAEIAQQLGISVLGCRTRLFRAKEHYRKIVQRDEENSENENETHV